MGERTKPKTHGKRSTALLKTVSNNRLTNALLAVIAVLIAMLLSRELQPPDLSGQNLYQGADEDNYYGQEWANVTQHVVDFANSRDDASFLSTMPLVVMFDDLVTDQWVQDVLDWYEFNREEYAAELEDLPWCFTTTPIDFVSRFRKKGINFYDNEPFVKGQYVCFKHPKTCKQIQDIMPEPSSLLMRDMYDSVMDKLENRLLKELNLPINYATTTNIIDYSDEADYKSHTDCSSGRMNDRVFSLLVYLSDHPSSGATHFDNLNINVYPKKGRTLIWRNLKRDEKTKLPVTCDTRTRHTAKPVRKGERKLALQIWFHQRPVTRTFDMPSIQCKGSGSCRSYIHATSRFDYGEKHVYSSGARNAPSYSLQDPYHDHFQQALRYHKQGDFQKTMDSFRAQAKFANGAHDWHNLGKAMFTVAERMGSREASIHLAHEAFTHYSKSFGHMLLAARGRYDMTHTGNHHNTAIMWMSELEESASKWNSVSEEMKSKLYEVSTVLQGFPDAANIPKIIQGHMKKD